MRTLVHPRQEGFWEDDVGGMWMQLPSGRWYLLCSEPTRTILGSDMGLGCFFLVLRGERSAGECVTLVHPLTQKLRSSRKWRLRRGPSSVSLRSPLEELPFLGLLLAMFALGKDGALFTQGFPPCSPVSGVWVMLEECRELDSSGDAVVLLGAMPGSTLATCSV